MTQQEFFKKLQLTQSEIAKIIGSHQSEVSLMNKNIKLLTVDQYFALTGKVADKTYLEMKRNFEINKIGRELIDYSNGIMTFFYKKTKKVISFDENYNIIFEKKADTFNDAINLLTIKK